MKIVYKSIISVKHSHLLVYYLKFKHSNVLNVYLLLCFFFNNTFYNMLLFIVSHANLENVLVNILYVIIHFGFFLYIYNGQINFYFISLLLTLSFYKKKLLHDFRNSINSSKMSLLSKTAFMSKI